MPRRASSSLNPVWIVVTIALIAAAVVGGRFLFQGVSDPYRTIPALEVRMYLENSNSLRGNVYKLTATVANALAWSPLEGRLFSVEVAGPGGTDVLPVLVPIQFNHLNIQKGQQFQMQIEVVEKGILKARDLRKA
jgi:hypothetical protein